ncbi:hypothetical protein VT84_09505 [Gemmata sp. SH-PL17]|uniref:hypothetical protein n=1 Tax=Gemmata sp. SH-PL17 TaxID=1630693 RepID=UPI00078BE431|nr:hypothetical protein [Gemmata sp. SH-PL17]AMV24620.1 hypothetical protein VT84_09505 [Gemmata sp. SH-PL17]
MLLADEISTGVTLIERYGSFGLVCVIVLAAIIGGVMFLRYVKNDFIPRAVTFLEDKDKRHETYLRERDVVCKQAAETASSAVDALQRNNEVLADLVTEVKRLKDRTDEHHAGAGARRRPSND